MALLAKMQDYSSPKAIRYFVLEEAKPLEVVSANRGGGFDFHADDIASTTLQNNVHLMPISIPEVGNGIPHR
ncbi:hypothetical protein CHEID_00880 [Corynebacterium heidelbergense]|nr:hypothetical protein CHEID_00880 [Corynebacterium heidelbergense]